MTTGKTTALPRQTFVDNVMSLLNKLRNQEKKRTKPKVNRGKKIAKVRAEINEIKFKKQYKNKSRKFFFKNKTDGTLDYDKRENLNKYIECAKGDIVTETTEI